MTRGHLLIPCAVSAGLLGAAALPAQEPEGEHFFGRREYYENKMPAGAGQFRVTGFAAAALADWGDGGAALGARFNPVFLWRLRPGLTAEAELGMRAGPPTEFGTEEGDAAEENLRVEVASLEWEACEWAALSAGRIRSPFGIYSLQYEPAFLEPFLTRPMIAGEGGLEPETLVGVALRGGAEGAGASAWHWDFFLGDAPELDAGTANPEESGLVRWEENGADAKSTMFGGRLGFALRPGFEVGVSGLQVRLENDAVAPAKLDGQLLGVDFQASGEVGRTRCRLAGEFVSSDVDDATYLPGTIDAFTFDNSRDGGWVFTGWRMTEGALAAAEAILRYDWMKGPEAGPLDAGEVRRWSAGVDWWLGEEEVLKFVVARTEREDEGAATGFGIEFAVGL